MQIHLGTDVIRCSPQAFLIFRYRKETAKVGKSQNKSFGSLYLPDLYLVQCVGYKTIDRLTGWSPPSRNHIVTDFLLVLSVYSNRPQRILPQSISSIFYVLGKKKQSIATRGPVHSAEEMISHIYIKGVKVADRKIHNPNTVPAGNPHMNCCKLRLVGSPAYPRGLYGSFRWSPYPGQQPSGPTFFVARTCNKQLCPIRRPCQIQDTLQI